MSDEYIKMDYSLATAEERVQKVKEIIANTPSERLTKRYLDKLGDYIVEAMSKSEKKQKKILTENRLVTINKRETSYEGLVSKLESGEDGLYNLISDNKNLPFQPKDPITEKDFAEIPELCVLKKAIDKAEARLKVATGHEAFVLKDSIISMRRDQYIIKKGFRRPIYAKKLVKTISKLNLDEVITIDEKGKVSSTCPISVFNVDHVSAVLCHFVDLKAETRDKLNSDMKWFLLDFEHLAETALKNERPLLYDVMLLKMNGESNKYIQDFIQKKYDTKHSAEYISYLWRHKIPELIVETATIMHLCWYYSAVEKGTWKTCSRCGKTKLAHNYFFSKNRSSKDGFYSICKSCRNSANKRR